MALRCTETQDLDNNPVALVLPTWIMSCHDTSGGPVMISTA